MINNRLVLFTLFKNMWNTQSVLLDILFISIFKTVWDTEKFKQKYFDIIQDEKHIQWFQIFVIHHRLFAAL